MNEKDREDLARLAAADGQEATTEQERRERMAFDNAMEAQRAHSTVEFAHAGVLFAKADAWKAAGHLVSIGSLVGLGYAITALVQVIR